MTERKNYFKEKQFILAVTILLAVMVFVITFFSIKESRSDSETLLVSQGKAFIESLAYAADNAMTSEEFYDYLVHKRYQEITVELSRLKLDEITDAELSRIAVDHDLYSIYVYGMDSLPIAGGIVRGNSLRPPEYIYDEVKRLIAEPEQNYVLLLDQGESPDEIVHYYLEINNRLDRVILIVADALYYVAALEQTEISSLASQMAQEAGIVYIVYQSSDSTLFSSKRSNEIGSMITDPFLLQAATSDTILYRKFEFEGEEILELSRPFATVDYPNGLLRIAISLDNLRTISKSFNIQMITLAIVLFGLVVALLLYFNSRTRRKEITRQYDQIKSLSDKIFEQMKTGVAAVDNQGQIILTNEAFAVLGELNNDQQNIWDSCFEASYLKFSAIKSHPGLTQEFELTVTGKDKSRILLIAISKLTNNANQFDGFVSVVSDITGIKELEQKSARKERLSEMGDLAAGVAHEIRNPLNSISIASQRLAAEFTPTENSDEYLDFTKQIREETRRLNEIINKFLALAKEQNPKADASKLKNVVEDFLTLIKYDAEEAGIMFNVSIDPNHIIKLSADSLKQILSNLYNNSKEALAGRAGVVSLSSSLENSKTLFIFEDSGPGIPEANRDKVFTPYFTTKEAGTGLGLPTVYRIVTDNGGEISVDSSDLGGVRFIITL